MLCCAFSNFPDCFQLVMICSAAGKVLATSNFTISRVESGFRYVLDQAMKPRLSARKTQKYRRSLFDLVMARAVPVGSSYLIILLRYEIISRKISGRKVI